MQLSSGTNQMWAAVT